MILRAIFLQTKLVFSMIIRLFIYLSFSVLAISAFAQESNNPVKTGDMKFETTSAEILGTEMASDFSELLKVDEKIKWSMHVPDNIDPASPPGIVVHMTQGKMAKLPFGWMTALKEKNLIWISLNKTGNLKQNKEMLLTVLATPFVQEKYKIDRSRIYIVASANSCYPASAAMEVYPDIFKGIIYSTCEPINWKSDTPQTIEQMKKNRYLFVSSNEKDIKLAMRRAYRKYTNSGLTKAEYMNIPKLVYGRQLDRRKFTQSIEILDNLN